MEEKEIKAIQDVVESINAISQNKIYKCDANGLIQSKQKSSDNHWANIKPDDLMLDFKTNIIRLDEEILLSKIHFKNYHDMKSQMHQQEIESLLSASGEGGKCGQ